MPPALQELQEGHPRLQQVPVSGHCGQAEGSVAALQGLSSAGPGLSRLAGHAVRLPLVVGVAVGGVC